MVEQVSLPGQGPGLDGLKDIIRAMRSGFPDIVFSIQEQVAEHDKVASRFEWTGTHNGEFLGIPGTGRPVRAWGVVIDRLEDGRIKDTRILMGYFWPTEGARSLATFPTRRLVGQVEDGRVRKMASPAGLSGPVQNLSP